MLLAAVGYARFDPYLMDGDGVAFLDLAQDLRTGHAGLAINGYWNPGYPAVLALAEGVMQPSLWREFVVVRYANVLVFAFAAACCLLFTTGLARARRLSGLASPGGPGGIFALPDGALHLLGLALLTFSLGRELPIGTPRSDTLLLAFLLLAMGLLLRLYTGGRLWLYPALGLALGCAYLTKSFAFLPSVALLLGLAVFALAHGGPQRLRIFGGTALVALVFALIAGPYIVAISRQLGHPTTGDSARLNYAFFIDATERWHEAYRGTLGHASGPLLHPEAPLRSEVPLRSEASLAAEPAVFSYAAHPVGTFPLWFDPAWWTAGLKPHVWWPGHVSRLARNLVVLGRYVLGRPEVFVLLAVLLGFGAAWPRWRSVQEGRAWLWALAPAGWGVLMFGIYLPIDLQDRYLTGPFLLILLPLFAVLRGTRGAELAAPADRPASGSALAAALVLLFAGLALVQSATYLAERRRHTPPAEQSHPGYDETFYTAAAALQRMGLPATGGKLACMGDRICDVDQYWARLAGAQILAEVAVPGEANPETVWNGIADKRTVTAPLAAEGIAYIVTEFPNSLRKPEGWVQLGPTNLFAYPLQRAVSPETAAAMATFQPRP